jgi:hypothetical protein
LTLDHKEQKLIRELERWHTGKAKAITFSRLAEEMKMPERELRDMVSRLVTVEEQLIGSTSDSGYFAIETLDEFNHVDRELTARIASLILRRSGLRRGWANRTAGQQVLFEAKEML